MSYPTHPVRQPTVPLAPMQNPAFDPLKGPKPLTCCECGGPLKNETYRVLRGQMYCDACANTES